MVKSKRFFVLDAHIFADGSMMFCLGFPMQYGSWKSYKGKSFSRGDAVFKVEIFDVDGSYEERKEFVLDLYLKGRKSGNFSTYRLD